jgi:hypothetical protein
MVKSFMVWTALSAIAVVGILKFWTGPNAVWGGIGLGVIAGVLTALLLFFVGGRFHWFIVEKWIVACSLLGVAIELLGKILERSEH